MTDATYCSVCSTDLAENDGHHQEGCFAADYGLPLEPAQDRGALREEANCTGLSGTASSDRHTPRAARMNRTPAEGEKDGAPCPTCGGKGWVRRGQDHVQDEGGA